MKKPSLFLILGLIGYVGFIFYLLYEGSLLPSQRVVQRIDLGQNNKLIVRADNSWEMSCPIWIQLSSDDAVLEDTYVGTSVDPDEVEFQVVHSSDRRILAVCNSAAPEVVYFLYDYHSQESWPHPLMTESYHATFKRGRDLLDRLKKDLNAKFILSHSINDSL